MNNIQSLQTDLETNVISVQFTKKDGSVRTMICTRDLSRVPEELRDGINDPKIIGPLIIGVYDFDNTAWRSFRKDKVIDYIVL